MAKAETGLALEFSAAMDRLGPFEPQPALAVAVSGGADSMATAILARDWVHLRDGLIIGLIIDHGLRRSSSEEARATFERLTRLGIPARILPLSGLTHGPALAERARLLRYEMLTRACREAGILHLLLGHHLGDQVETLAMRVLRGSQTHGLAAMSGVMETAGLRLLRPLLGCEPTRLRRLLTERSIGWIEDPSNQDTSALRSRLRRGLGNGVSHEPELRQAMTAVARLRAHEEAEAAAELAHRATIRPEGFALLSPGRIAASALSSLVRTIGGARYAPSSEQINDLAAQPRPATLAGVQIVPAGRLGDGMLIVREQVSMMPPVAARRDAVWDHRFRLGGSREFPPTATIGKLGPEAARFRKLSGLPSVILQTLPAVRVGECLVSVPHLGYSDGPDDARVTLLFAPPRPAAAACFVPAR